MVDIEVIGAGFGRTGTASLYVALNKLGYKTHHMKEVFCNINKGSAWLKLARDRNAGLPIDWESVLGGYTAAVDWPSVAVYRELLAANPNAKVILTLRDFDSWYESALTTIYRMGQVGDSIRPPCYLAPIFRGITDFFRMHHELFWQGTFQGRFTDKEFVRQVYESHLEEVRRVVPPAQLLEFHVKEGWGPLCDFLGKPVPQGEPFPRINDNEEFVRNIVKVQKIARRLSIGFVVCNTLLTAGAAAALVMTVMRRRCC
ncbi:hypothetical protein Agub_g9640 [Astrephomene gubernaculifera]|uniref:Sulfotransferase n=1 Tax=Astrephomene gubernaculifera TaxID=47775 RepID=A0AAD3HP80_9CHLO|nr:hypothetical protein Agub_g9640 [Astrephomene gubernaculifera]